MAIDFLGQNLSVGDDVVYLNYNRTSADLERGKITKLFEHTAEIGNKRRAEYKIVKMPADVAPVVHGRWNSMDGYKTRVVCSECGWDVPEYGKFYSYCPNCGAKMDGGDSDAAD